MTAFRPFFVAENPAAIGRGLPETRRRGIGRRRGARGRGGTRPAPGRRPVRVAAPLRQPPALREGVEFDLQGGRARHPVASQMGFLQIVLLIWLLSSFSEEVYVRGLVQSWIADRDEAKGGN